MSGHTDPVTDADARASRRGRPGVLGALALATDTADEILLGTVRDVHGAVASRVHRFAGRPIGAGKVSGAVYAGLGGGLRATSRGLRAADRRGLGGRVDSTPAGRVLVSAVNGLIGDRLVEDGSEL